MQTAKNEPFHSPTLRYFGAVPTWKRIRTARASLQGKNCAKRNGFRCLVLHVEYNRKIASCNSCEKRSKS